MQWMLKEVWNWFEIFLFSPKTFSRFKSTKKPNKQALLKKIKSKNEKSNQIENQNQIIKIGTDSEINTAVSQSNDLSLTQTEQKLIAIENAASGGMSSKGFQTILNYLNGNELSNSFRSNGITLNSATSAINIVSLMFQSGHVNQSSSVTILKTTLRQIVLALAPQLNVSQSPLFLEGNGIALLASREFVRRARNLTTETTADVSTLQVSFSLPSQDAMASKVPLTSITFIQAIYSFTFNLYPYVQASK